MLTGRLGRRLERLEDRLLPHKDEPMEFIIEYVGMDGQIVSTFVLGAEGSRTWTESNDLSSSPTD